MPDPCCPTHATERARLIAEIRETLTHYTDPAQHDEIATTTE